MIHLAAYYHQKEALQYFYEELKYPLDYLHPVTDLSALSYAALTDSVECL